MHNRSALRPQKAPDVNACKPPEQWQTYDITFRAPRVDDQNKVTEKGEVTVVFNGETVIDKGRFDRVNNGVANEKQGIPGPILLQEAVRVDEGDTPEALHARIQEVEHRLLPAAVRMLLGQTVSP